MDQIQPELGQRRSKRKMLSCYYSSRKSKKTTRHYILEDIIGVILQKLPAELNYNVMRNVCTNWRNTILHDSNFINSHLKNSSHGLIFCGGHWGGFQFVEETNPNGSEMRVTSHKLDCGFSGYIWSTCNGLILDRTCTPHDFCFEFRLLNPITKPVLILPPSCFIVNKLSTKCAIGYVASSGEYKVVKVDVHTDKDTIPLEILTLGHNKHGHWRSLHSLPKPKFSPLKTYSAVNFIHWQNLDSSCLVSLNLENETFSKLPYPSAAKEKLLLVMEDKLTLVSLDGKNMLFFEIWLLLEEDHKWMKLCEIDLQSQKSLLESILQGQTSSMTRIGSLWPVGWLKSMQVVFFVLSPLDKILIAYNIRTGKVHPFKVENASSIEPWNFIRSLVSPDASWINSKN